MCLVQEAEQEEVKVIADPQPPRSAKKGKASASSTPQTGSDKKERKGKHKGQPASIKTNRERNRQKWNEWTGDLEERFDWQTDLIREQAVRKGNWQQITVEMFEQL